MARRRLADEGSYYRMCSAGTGCPDPQPVEGENRTARPPHDCHARWAYALDLGFVGGKRTRKVVVAKTKRECARKADDLRKKIALGVSPTAQTVGDWLDYWLAVVAPASGVRPTTIKGYQSKIDRYLRPALGHRKLQELTPEHVESLHTWMRTLDKSRTPGQGTGPLSDTTIRQAHMVLRSALADALTRGKVMRNVAAVVRAPKAADHPHEKLPKADAKKVIKAATSERELCRLVCALVLGVRQGEALGLRWQDYQIIGESHYLVVEEAIQRIGGKLIRTDVKSRASRRRLPLPEGVRPIFAAWREKTTDPTGYIFPGLSGQGPDDARRDWQAWRDSLARAGVNPSPLHGARGSAASLLADMGVPDWMIAEILGHSQVVITRKHYIEGTEERHAEALGGLVDALLP